MACVSLGHSIVLYDFDSNAVFKVDRIPSNYFEKYKNTHGWCYACRRPIRVRSDLAKDILKDML